MEAHVEKERSPLEPQYGSAIGQGGTLGRIGRRDETTQRLRSDSERAMGPANRWCGVAPPDPTIHDRWCRVQWWAPARRVSPAAHLTPSSLHRQTKGSLGWEGIPVRENTRAQSGRGRGGGTEWQLAGLDPDQTDQSDVPDAPSPPGALTVPPESETILGSSQRVQPLGLRGVPLSIVIAIACRPAG
jgi:hypothetical protein